jgi:hypothetical protein
VGSGVELIGKMKKEEEKRGELSLPLTYDDASGIRIFTLPSSLFFPLTVTHV